MALALTLTQSQTLVALRSFLVSILPSTTAVIQGQVNRVAEPSQPDYVVMTPMFNSRLGTNVVTYADTAFMGSLDPVAGLTVTQMLLGSIVVGVTLFGVGVQSGTTITGLGTGTGGAGTYAVSQAQSLPASKLASGTATSTKSAQVSIQIDIHGPNAADNADIINTMLRDDYAVEAFAALNTGVTPLYAEDPKQMPFINAANQYENRWVVTAVLECEMGITYPEQFADQLIVVPINAEDFPA